MLAVLQRQQERHFVMGRRESSFLNGGAGRLVLLDGGGSSSWSLYESMVDNVLMSQHMHTPHPMQRLNLFSPAAMHNAEAPVDGATGGLYQKSHNFRD